VSETVIAAEAVFVIDPCTAFTLTEPVPVFAPDVNVVDAPEVGFTVPSVVGLTLHVKVIPDGISILVESYAFAENGRVLPPFTTDPEDGAIVTWSRTCPLLATVNDQSFVALLWVEELSETSMWALWAPSERSDAGTY
jgi:hypothetical protein